MGADPREMVSVSRVGLLVLTDPLVDVIRKASQTLSNRVKAQSWGLLQLGVAGLLQRLK